MGAVEDPLVLKKFMGMLSKKKQFLLEKGMWVEGMIASYSILELNQSKVNRVLLTQICQWPSYVSSGPQRFFVIIEQFLTASFFGTSAINSLSKKKLTLPDELLHDDLVVWLMLNHSTKQKKKPLKTVLSLKKFKTLLEKGSSWQINKR